MANIKPQLGDLIQTPESNYIVLSLNADDITLKEIKSSRIGIMPNHFKYTKIGTAPNGQTPFVVSSTKD